MPVIRQWVESGRCLPEFLSLFSSDLRQLEEEARSKVCVCVCLSVCLSVCPPSWPALCTPQVQSALKSMELFRKLSTPISEETQRRMMEDRQVQHTSLDQETRLSETC